MTNTKVITETKNILNILQGMLKENQYRRQMIQSKISKGMTQKEIETAQNTTKFLSEKLMYINMVIDMIEKIIF